MMKETLSSLLSVKISFLDRKKWGNKGKPLPAPTVYQWRQGWGCRLASCAFEEGEEEGE
jgi:hypothetical protein